MTVNYDNGDNSTAVAFKRQQEGANDYEYDNATAVDAEDANDGDANNAEADEEYDNDDDDVLTMTITMKVMKLLFIRTHQDVIEAHMTSVQAGVKDEKKKQGQAAHAKKLF